MIIILLGTSRLARPSNPPPKSNRQKSQTKKHKIATRQKQTSGDVQGSFAGILAVEVDEQSFWEKDVSETLSDLESLNCVLPGVQSLGIQRLLYYFAGLRQKLLSGQTGDQIRKSIRFGEFVGSLRSKKTLRYEAFVLLEKLRLFFDRRGTHIVPQKRLIQAWRSKSKCPSISEKNILLFGQILAFLDQRFSIESFSSQDQISVVWAFVSSISSQFRHRRFEQKF